ncbi:MAG: hypothetical protein ACXW3P_05945 [Rhodospirillales bacterium]
MHQKALTCSTATTSATAEDAANDNSAIGDGTVGISTTDGLTLDVSVRCGPAAVRLEP